MKDSFKYLIVIILILILAATFSLWKKSKSKEVLPESGLPNIMKLSSPAFENGGQIPEKYSCEGEDINPPLEIKDVPDLTQSLVLIVEDPDAPSGNFLHWLVFNIPAQTSLIEENSLPPEAIEGKNDFGKENYGGPCPSLGTHRYFFKLHALDTQLVFSETPGKKEVEGLMKGHILDMAQLMAKYKRQ